jgi:hypothetical protein
MKQVLTDNKLHEALNHYKRHYLNKKFEDLDESATRIIINHFLSDVLGYKELVDIKTEYPIRGGFIDYLIILRRKKIVVEAKSISTRLSSRHLRQATYYAATIGADWMVLTNGRNLELYKIRYTKPLAVNKLFSIDLRYIDADKYKQVKCLTKKSVLRGDLDSYPKDINY